MMRSGQRSCGSAPWAQGFLPRLRRRSRGRHASAARRAQGRTRWTRGRTTAGSHAEYPSRVRRIAPLARERRRASSVHAARGPPCAARSVPGAHRCVTSPLARRSSRSPRSAGSLAMTPSEVRAAQRPSASGSASEPGSSGKVRIWRLSRAARLRLGEGGLHRPPVTTTSRGDRTAKRRRRRPVEPMARSSPARAARPATATAAAWSAARSPVRSRRTSTRAPER